MPARRMKRWAGRRWQDGDETSAGASARTSCAPAIAYTLADEAIALDRLRAKFLRSDDGFGGVPTRSPWPRLPISLDTEAFRTLATRVTSSDTPCSTSLEEYASVSPKPRCRCARATPTGVTGSPVPEDEQGAASPGAAPADRG